MVKVFCLEGSLSRLYREEIIEGVVVKKFKQLVGDPLYIPSLELMKELRKEDPDIIHVHNVHTLLPMFIAMGRKYFSGKIVLQPHYHSYGQSTIRNFLLSVYKVILSATSLQYVDAIIANSKYEAICLKEDFPRISSKIILVPEECSIEIPSSIKWNPSIQPKRIMYVGGLRRYKNVDVLLRSFKILSSRREDLELVLIGNGPERKRLFNLAFKLGIHKQVTWKSGLPHDELLQEISRASAVVLLSKLESFSRVAHEAIAIGTPLIVHNYGVLKELVKRGLAVGVGKLDPAEVADAIDTVLNADWKPANTRFSHTHVSYADLMMKVYKSLMSR